VADKVVTASKSRSRNRTQDVRSLVAERAYLKWLAQTKGSHPVSDEQTRQNWLDAEREIAKEND